MSVPSIERRPRLRVRVWIIIAILVLVVLLFSLRGLAGFYTDYLWFDEVHFGSVWRDLLLAKIVPAAVFTVLFFVLMLVSLTIADRLAPRVRTSGAEDELLDRYQQIAGRYAGRIRVAVSAFFALIAGASVAGEWQQWILFNNRVDFGVKDPQFHRDVGFYVFQLPFIKYVLDWLFAALVIIFIVTAVAHYLNGGIRLQSPYQRVTPQVKAHLSVILALMALVKASQYWFAQYELDFSTRGVIQGASYTDVHAQLQALRLLIFIAVIAAGLFIWNIWRRGWVLPIIAVGLWALLSLLVGTIYPAFVQNFRVRPNELAKEQPYIRRNIEATRAAFGLNHVSTPVFDYRNNLDATAVAADGPSLANARLWDPGQLLTFYKTAQTETTSYKFGNTDIDRYTIGGKLTPVFIAPRELNREELPSQTWVNRHLVFTHGYGAAVSPANAVSADQQGSPTYLLGGIPPQVAPDAAGSLTLREPRIYYGEDVSGYSLVDGKQRELDFQTAARQSSYNRYHGKGGVQLSSWLRRTAFALRFGDYNLFISGDVTTSTKIMFNRDILPRVRKAAPFLRFDADPYPAVVDGRVVWIVDGYTATDRYPYSQSYQGSGGLSGRFNYVRNSVKATVDAYDGTMKLYVVDRRDPLVRAYRKAFPSLFTDGSTMSADLRAHLRYPQDLFSLQTDVYALYHIQNSSTFYNKTDLWLVSVDPGTGIPIGTGGGEQGASSTSVTSKPQAATSTGKRIDPIYMMTQLPGKTTQDFVIMRPFVPVSAGNKIQQLVSFMVATSGPGDYGQIIAYQIPNTLTVQSPDLANSAILNTTEISAQFTLLNQAGSTVLPGNMQLIPVGDSILYVRPIFVQAQSSSGLQALRFVAIVYGGRAVLGCTVDDGLAQLFNNAPPDPSCRSTGATTSTTAPGGGASGSPSSTTTTPTTTTPPTTTVPPPTGSIQSLLAQAAAAYDDAQSALKAGDLGRYQSDIDRMGVLLKQAQQLAGSSAPSTTVPKAPPQQALAGTGR